MAFSVTTRSLVAAATILAALTSSPVHAVDFSKVLASASSAAGTVSASTTTTATTKPTSATATTKPAIATGSTSSGASTSTTTASSSSLPTTITKTVDGWPGPVVVKGNKFFNSKTGAEFRMKGMAYYPRPNGGELATVANYDWFTDEYEAVWTPHIAIMQDLGVNTIRIYSVDPGKSHDKFMCACAEAGIYVLVGMAAPCENCAILDLNPPQCYPDALFTRMQAVYNAFAVYDNVLGFSVANENNLLRTFEKTGVQTMPCAKALLRDVRNYAASCSGSLRQVPIGIDLADILPRPQWLEYMDCAIGNNEYTRAQWIGFNPYVECDQTTHLTYAQSAGLQNLMSVYDNVKYPRPLMFGEFGCNLGKNTIDGYENQRAFYDAKWMNDEANMTAQIVGGNVFEFVTEIPNTVAKKLTKAADPGKYGVGYFSPDTCDHVTIPCVFVPYPEYANLKKAYTTTKASTLTMSSYTVDRTNVLTCPTNISSTLRPMPTTTALACATGASSQPMCNGAKSNAGTKNSKAPALGSSSQPSNTEISGASGSNSTGKGTSAAVVSTPSSMVVAAVSALTLAVSLVVA